MLRFGTDSYGECAVLGNGSINIHAGKRFDLHGLLCKGFMSKKDMACYSGLIHRFVPLFLVDGEWVNSFDIKSSDYSWNWLGDSLILENKMPFAKRTVYVKNDRNFIIQHLETDKPLRYLFQFPFEWDIKFDKNILTVSSRKWKGLLVKCAFNGTMKEVQCRTFKTSVAEFSIPDAPEITVTEILLDLDSAAIFCMGVGKDVSDSELLSLAASPPESLLETERLYWKNWMSRILPLESGDERLNTLYLRNYLAIKSCSFDNGSIMAGDRGYYQGLFTRDTLSSMFAMSLNGQGGAYKDYWTMLCNAERDSAGRLFAAYDVDGAPWNRGLEIDQFAMVPLSIYLQYTASGDIDLLEKTMPLTEYAVNYFSENVPPLHTFYKVYDEWFSDAYTSPLGCLGYIHAGLAAASKIAEILKNKTLAEKASSLAAKMREQVSEFMYSEKESSFARAIFPHVARFDMTADSYMLHASRFAIINEDFALIKPWDTRMKSTVSRLEEKLLKADGTLARHEKELHPWAITTMWLAQHHFAAGNPARGMELLKSLAHKNEGSFYDIANCLWLMPEQWNGESGAPWRCDLLTWSHGETLLTMICGMSGYRPDHVKPRFIAGLPNGIERIESFVYHMGKKLEFLVERDGGSINFTLKNYDGPSEIWIPVPACGSFLTSQYFEVVSVNGKRVKPAGIRKLADTIYMLINS